MGRAQGLLIGISVVEIALGLAIALSATMLGWAAVAIGLAMLPTLSTVRGRYGNRIPARALTINAVAALVVAGAAAVLAQAPLAGSLMALAACAFCASRYLLFHAVQADMGRAMARYFQE